MYVPMVVDEKVLLLKFVSHFVFGAKFRDFSSYFREFCARYSTYVHCVHARYNVVSIFETTNKVI